MIRSTPRRESAEPGILPVRQTQSFFSQEKPPRKAPSCSCTSTAPSHHGVTRNFVLLLSVPLGVVTSTVPFVAPVGTVVLISDFETTVNVADVPLNVTLVAPVRLVPRILTAAPTLPDVVCVSTNGPRPTDKLKTSPQPSKQ